MTDGEHDIAFAGAGGQAALVRDGTISSVELTELGLARIERLNPLLNAFRIVMTDEALAEAAARDAAPAGERGPLHGVPIAIKDEIDVAGQLTTFGTAARTRPADQDAGLVARLRNAGAVIVGKTAMPEFGAFPFTESSTYGITRNPWDVSRTTGGSSGGTACAVAAGMVAAGIGGDGGGSIRIPSACCGLFGLKPTRGLVSTEQPIWHALGTVGPLTRTVADSALIYDVIRSAGGPAGAFGEAVAAEPGTLRIGLCARPAQPGIRLHPEQRRALEETAGALRALGHAVTPLDPGYPELAPAFVPQVYGGIRDEALLVERPELLERRTRQALLIARAFPEPIVRAAIRHGERLATRVNAVFDRCDLLLTPTIAPLPRRIGALDGLSNIRAGIRSFPYIAYTAVWNVCGNPAAAIPAGFATGGIPLSAQLIARPGADSLILALAAQLERSRPWAGRRPPV